MTYGSQLWIARYAPAVNEAFFYAAVTYAQGSVRQGYTAEFSQVGLIV